MTPLAALVAVASAGAAMRWGALVAGGSDSYCYLGQARMWVDGTLLRPLAPGFDATWPNAIQSLTPTGFVPSETIPGGITPICPPGLSLVMAGATAIAGDKGPLAIVPVCAAIVVWCAFVLGRRLAGPGAGLMAAVLSAASPIVIFQAWQPMSDIPAAAGWLAALALAARGTPGSASGAGLATAIAVLIRPNLAPLGVLVAIVVALAPPETARWRTRLARVLRYGAGVAPGVIAVAGLNHVLYGSALRSGYGNPADLFALRHVRVNLDRYPRWLVETHTLWVLLGVLAPVLLPNGPARRWWNTGGPRGLATACLLVIGGNATLYLFYVPFNSWAYLRFVLIGVVLLIVLASAATVALTARVPALLRLAAVGLVTAGVGHAFVEASRARVVFDVRNSEGRFVETAVWLREHLPPNAVFLTIWHSGSVRYYGDRPVVLWDTLPPDQLDHVLASLERQGRKPYILVEVSEIETFRDRFRGGSALGELDWPPRAQIGRDVHIYDPPARRQYLEGRGTPTERVWTAAERSQLRRR